MFTVPLFLLFAFAEPPPPPIPAAPAVRMPFVVEPHAPTPAPKPPVPRPVAVPVLTPDVLFVIDSDVECVVTSSPLGSVTITPEAGPQTIKAKFIDGNGKIQTRKFAGKFLYFIEPTAKPSAAKVEILVVPNGSTNLSQWIRQSVSLNLAPQPPPVPPKPPTPPQPAAPIAGDGFKVLIVYDAQTAQTLPPGQQAAIFGKPTRDYLNAKCAKRAGDNQAEWRIYPLGTVMTEETKVWQDAVARPRTSTPWIVVSNPQNGGGFEGPLPATDAEITALLRKYGGN